MKSLKRPVPTDKDVTEELFQALHSFEGAPARWKRRQETGLSDEGLLDAIRDEFGDQGGVGRWNLDPKGCRRRAGPVRFGHAASGGARPRFYFGMIAPAKNSKPTFQGKELVDEVRELMRIPKLPAMRQSREDIEQGLFAFMEAVGQGGGP